MDKKQLHQYVTELEYHLIHFKQISQGLEEDFQQSLQHVRDPDTRYKLMESYATNINQQEKIIVGIIELHQKAVQQLAEMEQ